MATKSLMISIMTAAFAGLAATAAVAQQSAPPTTNNAAGLPARGAQTKGTVVFTAAAPGAISNAAAMRTVGMADVTPVVMATATAGKTDVWVASTDVASLPGTEMMVVVKGPATCGAMGCEMSIVSNAGGTERTLLRTMGETVDIVGMDRVIVNRGSRFQVLWKFDGAKFVEVKSF